MTNQEYEGRRSLDKATVSVAVCLFVGVFGFFTGLWFLGAVARFFEALW